MRESLTRELLSLIVRFRIGELTDSTYYKLARVYWHACEVADIEDRARENPGSRRGDREVQAEA